jgi:pyridoxamine 5'-phosphate oxidase
MNLNTIRIDYKSQSLSKHDVSNNPILQFEKWMNEALEANIADANAFTLSTVDELNKPSSRIILLKDFGNSGFVFYTNYDGKKGRDIEQNNNVNASFYWKELERQVRIEGTAQKLDDVESDEYFATRPRESQIGAWASPQSSVIHNRPVLESRVEFYSNKFNNKIIPRPSNWGGYLIKPSSIEFWQGRASRLHDRILFELKDRQWNISRLAP